MEPDLFNGVTNQDFIAYFKVDLHSRTEIINYTYPHELLDEDSGFGEHVQRCLMLLKDYILLCFKNGKAARREQKNLALENDETSDQKMQRRGIEMVQQTPEQKRERLEIEKTQEKAEMENKYKELRDEIAALIDEHHQKVKIIYVDL
ncbi:hypothetical protein [Flavobacterium sp. HJSW_4]|uniref:hypothetical protein n=1 Tax=Flavobacterium sp. HJSW_4 TaxID=3344660 RepID=UPI0035F4E4E7